MDGIASKLFLLIAGLCVYSCVSLPRGGKPDFLMGLHQFVGDEGPWTWM